MSGVIRRSRRIGAPRSNGGLAQNEPSSAIHVIESHQNRRAALVLRQPAAPVGRA
jgi:hypothetical protein